MFHFIDTIKVRAQARNLKHDVGYYFKNNVQKKPVISGIVSGFWGALTSSFTFIWVFNNMTWLLYSNDKYREVDFRLKNYLIYSCSDFWASFMRIFFESRKQLIQMCNSDITMGQISRAWYLGITPLIIRDFMFRSTLLGVLAMRVIDIEWQKPELKYSFSEMIRYVNHWRENGEPEATLRSKMYLFVDYHNYKISTPMHFRFLWMLFANLLGTILTNPIDVCLTKIVTQKERKYSGLINCLKTVYKEEGWRKLCFGGIHPRFMFNLINGTMFLYLYDQVIIRFHEVYSERYKEN
jgi:hypothetical protein